MKKVLKVVLDVLAWILLVVAFLVTILVFASARNGGIPNLFGIMPMSVQSDSMSPTFNKGDMIIVKEIDDLYTLKKDDVITFYTIVDGSRIINTHRIVEINENEGSRSFITRGDANSVDDNLPVGAADIIGKWSGTRLKGIGSFFDFLQTKTGFFVCVIIPIALFFIFELYKFIVTLIAAKKEAAGPELDEEEIKRKAVEEYLAKQAAEKAAAEGAGDAAEKAAEDTAKAVEDTAAKAVEDVTKAAETAEATSEKAEDTVKKSVDDAADIAKEAAQGVSEAPNEETKN